MSHSPLTVNEIYHSIQGESTHAGEPCVFVRLTFCNLRCTYCDTAYAFYEGRKMSIADIVSQVESYRCPTVELTGGEPLMQPGSLELMRQLADRKLKVLLETGGSLDISGVDSRVHIIMDLKCPDSGESAKNRWENIPLLKKKDEVKFVIGSREDYVWSKDVLRRYDLDRQVGTILFSVVFGRLQPQRLVEWILEDRLPVRFQLQMHKIVWDPRQKGV